MAKPYAPPGAQMSPDAQRQAEEKAQALRAAMSDGWSLWAYTPLHASPYRYHQVELMRREWTAPLRCDPWTLHPLMHVEGLFWRPVDDAMPVVRWREEDTP